MAQMQEEAAQKSLDVEVQAAIEAASPVPETFDQACAWACASVLNAAELGNTKQTIYFNAGGSDDSQISGELGNIIDFSETFCKMLCQAAPLEEGTVRIVLPDMGAAALVKSKWEMNSDSGELPENLLIDYFPSNISSEAREGSAKFVELLDSEILVILAPKQAECVSIVRLIDGMDKVGRDIPLVLINAQLGAGPGIAMKEARKLLQKATHTYHMAQYEPISDDPDMAAGVVSRVWPRPYSIWEDFPEDPDATNGYFLLDVSERAPDQEMVFTLLEASRDLRVDLIKRTKQMAVPRTRS